MTAYADRVTDGPDGDRPDGAVVATRPVAGTTGVGISLVGHHEILIPLIAAAACEASR